VAVVDLPASAQELAGKVAVITGGGSGLGAAMANLFAGVGMSVAVLDVNGGAAEATAQKAADDFGVRAVGLKVDVGSRASVAAAADRVRSVFGSCDVLCANVGVQQFGAVDQLTDQDWQWVIEVNVLGTVWTVREFLPLLRSATGWRQVVLTSSANALAPGVRLAAYQTSKFAVMGFGESLRAEVAEEGIGVTVLFPDGMITSHLQSSALARPAQLGQSELRREDVDAMLADRPITENDLVTPEHAVRNLLADLMANVPYSLTHGSYRPRYAKRRDALESALDRMEGT
jgi:NAD(P)-dependent dehydrogenase (short-subunit alcohol dehydrogenase family)